MLGKYYKLLSCQTISGYFLRCLGIKQHYGKLICLAQGHHTGNLKCLAQGKYTVEEAIDLRVSRPGVFFNTIRPPCFSPVVRYRTHAQLRSFVGCLGQIFT